jgi:hypothetical protein
LHHTNIGLCKHCDIQKIITKSPHTQPLIAFCDILLRYVSLIEAWPLCKLCQNCRLKFNYLQHMASGVCMSKQFLR